MNVEELVAIAMEIESIDPIDWGMLNINEEDAYRLMALNAVELYKDSDRVTLLASIIKLLVENLTLNVRLLQK